ncbi:MAG TPA: hypothetical protein DIU15_03235 [Deltaproteobacteria bacterium]|nr:hypothetical protein [Deltaproteobacteria bacterium]HCP45025.1 hypothetical protein [Deltaproteobacteria bacterium]|tara:strand:+ start:168 stop:1751 length:1584 start_codon:yes stop_codon:yes gene_type:complete
MNDHYQGAKAVVPPFRRINKWVLGPLLQLIEGAAVQLGGNETAPIESPLLDGNFTPTSETRAPTALDIEGELPENLRGTFFRIGPNPRFEPKGRYHLFDGDGMVHAVNFAEGGVSYASHWVRTSKYVQEDRWGRAAFINIGEMTGWVGLAKIILERTRGALGVVYLDAGTGRANTKVIEHAGRVLALHEGDAPYEIEVDDYGALRTVGRLDFGGQLKSPFSAHPKIDPETGELHFCSYDVRKPPHCMVGTVDARGQLARLVAVDLPEPVMMHDSALTQRFNVIVAPSVVFRPKEMVKRKALPFVVDPEQPLRIGLLPRESMTQDDVRWFDLPSGSVVHTLNAWDDGDTVHIYACRSDVLDLNSLMSDETPVFTTDSQSQLIRIVLNLETGEASQEAITPADMILEFPRTREDRMGLPSRFGYCSRFAAEHSLKVTSLVKIDLTGTVDNSVVGEIVFAPGRFGGECSFVAKSTGEEDDGYLMVHVHDEVKGQSCLEIYDAKHMSPEPLARVTIPVRVPYGFHSSWVSA